MLSGEPDYRSVNITWAIDDPIAAPATNADDNYTDEDTADVRELPQFSVFYCEMQSWGAHRCKSQLVEDSNEVDSNEQ